MTNIDSIKKELNFFIKKYYKNKLLKGFLYFLVIFLSSFYIISFAEFFGRFNSVIRLSFLIGFIILNTYIFSVYCIQPLWCLLNDKRRLKHATAAKMIGNLFPDIADQLTNLLQLEGQRNKESNNVISLLQASIEQKISNIGFIEFSKAISYSESKKYLKYVLPAVMLFFLFLGFLPEMFTQGSYRVLNFSQEFKEKAPYHFSLINTDLSISEGEDLKVQILLSGNNFPDRLYMNSERGVFLMNRLQTNLFETIIRKPKNKQSFYITSSKFKSPIYTIKVLGKNILGKWDALITFPSYLNMKEDLIKNSGDIIVPEGSEIIWSGKTRNVSQIKISSGDERKDFVTSGFNFKAKFLKTQDVNIVLTNTYTNLNDSLNYTVEVIKDAYPTISVEERKDSLQQGVRYFQGMVTDDYGLKKINFHYTVKAKNGKKSNRVINFKNVKGTRG